MRGGGATRGVSQSNFGIARCKRPPFCSTIPRSPLSLSQTTLLPLSSVRHQTSSRSSSLSLALVTFSVSLQFATSGAESHSESMHPHICSDAASGQNHSQQRQPGNPTHERHHTATSDDNDRAVTTTSVRHDTSVPSHTSVTSPQPVGLSVGRFSQTSGVRPPPPHLVVAEPITARRCQTASGEGNY